MESVPNISFDLQALVESNRNNPLKQRTGLSGRLYPNGEFTLGIVPPKRVSEKEKAFDAEWEDQYIECDRWKRDYRGARIETERYFQGDNPDYIRVKNERSSIGLSLLTNSHNGGTKPRKPRGHKGITSLGKRTVRNGAWLLQKSAGRKRLGFLTVTLPSMPDRLDVMAVLIGEWSEMVRQFFQELTRAIERKGKKALWVGCTEVQEKRFEKHGQPAPHLHAVYVAHDGKFNWYVTAAQMRAIWKRIIEARLKAIFNEDLDIDCGASIDCQTVKKDASGYLAKYLSKGGDVIEKMKDRQMDDLIPSAWWHCCTKLKRQIKALVEELPSDIKIAIRQGVDLVERGVCRYVFDVMKDDRRFGWVGKLKRSMSIDRNLLQVLECA